MTTVFYSLVDAAGAKARDAVRDKPNATDFIYVESIGFPPLLGFLVIARADEPAKGALEFGQA